MKLHLCQAIVAAALLPVAHGRTCDTLLCKILNIATLGLLNLASGPEFDTPDDMEDVPNGIVADPICDGLLGLVKNFIVEQTGGEGGEADDDFINGAFESIDCGCQFKGRDLKIGCDIDQPICLPLDLTSGFGNADDILAEATATAKNKTEVCGSPKYRGYLDRPRRIALGRPNLKSQACLELSGDAITTGDFKTFSREICINADHVDGITGATKIEGCSIYVKRLDGTTFDQCTSCTACPTDDFSIKFDCSNIDLDESPDRVVKLPLKLDQCFSAGLVSAKDLKKGEGAYKPFLMPTN